VSAKRTPVDGDDSDDLNAFTFFEQFPDEQAAIAYLEAERWPDRVECPRCGHHITRPIKNRYTHYCAGCKKQFSVRTGSIFEHSNIPLRKWIYAMYVFQNAHKGIYHQWSRKHGGRYGNEVAYRLTEGRMSVPIVTRVRRFARRSFEVQLTYKELVR